MAGQRAGAAEPDFGAAERTEQAAVPGGCPSNRLSLCCPHVSGKGTNIDSLSTFSNVFFLTIILNNVEMLLEEKILAAIILIIRMLLLSIYVWGNKNLIIVKILKNAVKYVTSLMCFYDLEVEKRLEQANIWHSA